MGNRPRMCRLCPRIGTRNVALQAGVRAQLELLTFCVRVRRSDGQGPSAAARVPLQVAKRVCADVAGRRSVLVRCERVGGVGRRVSPDVCPSPWRLAAPVGRSGAAVAHLAARDQRRCVSVRGCRRHNAHQYGWRVPVECAESRYYPTGERSHGDMRRTGGRTGRHPLLKRRVSNY